MRIICTAKIANTTVGHIDHALAYAVGFQRMGHEVYLMEQVGANRCTDVNNQKVPFEQWHGRLHFERVAKSYGLWPNCCLFYKQGEASHGMTFSKAVITAKQCDLLITRSGQIHKAPDIFENAKCRIYFDGNPGNTQFLLAQNGGDFEALDRYDFLFTLGLNIGNDSCPIPTADYHWHTQTRPVILAMWPASFNSDNRYFSTISSWKGRSTFQWQGRFSGEKSANWLNFIELPKATKQAFELALRINGGNSQADRMKFQEYGWRIRNPDELRNFEDYRNYIAHSRGEFSVAHNRYVEFNTGWFSDRSALYLASGKPVLVQSTGIENYLPTGKGLLTFKTLEEAAAGIEEINRDYLRHCQAAREIAVEYFDAGKVLGEILQLIDS